MRGLFHNKLCKYLILSLKVIDTSFTKTAIMLTYAKSYLFVDQLK